MPDLISTAVSSLPSIIETLRVDNPPLADALSILLKEQKRVASIIDPKPVLQTKTSQGAIALPPNVSGFIYTTTNRNIVLSWDAPTPEFFYYEIRIGTSWDTASRILTTATLQAILDPILAGTTTYLIKAINSNGAYSAVATSLDVIIPIIGSLTITSALIGSFVLLSWTIPTTTFDIDYYIVARDGVEFSRIKSTFLSTQVFAAGNYTYSVTAYDIIGNASPTANNTVAVPAPADFILKHNFSSAFGGTKVNAIQDGATLLVCVDTAKTWATHFSSKGWANIQDQINAGYPLYIQPSATTASYKETFDIGVLYTNTVINLSYLYTLISGTFNVGFSTRVSDDGISWSSPDTNMSFFAASVRYIEVTVSFTGSNDKALMSFYNFNIAVTIKEEMDSGEISAVSTDVNGTVVTFNKSFKDVDSITVSTKTTTEQFTVVYRFNDIPNPTSFSVFVYDTSGIRVSKTVQWKARGIL